MTPSAIIALVRDVAIVGALAFIIWRIYSDGENSVKVADMQAVQKQLAVNAAQQSRWAQEAQDAAKQRTQDLAQVTAAIGQQRTPIVLQPASYPTCPNPVPAATASSNSKPAGSGGIISGAGADSRDIRPAINAFELRLESTLADCRAALASWPH